MRAARVLGPAAMAVAIACHAGAPASMPAAADRVDRAARACAMITSCAHPHDAPREHDPGACVEGWLSRTPAEVEPIESCLAAAVGCAQVDACARGPGDPVAAAYCRSHAGTRTGCEGNVLVTCFEDDPSKSTSTSCAAFGATCGDSKQAGGLLARACLSPAACPAGAPEVRCDGPGAILSCHEGAVERAACSAPARCEEHRAADGAVSAVCQVAGRPRCDTVGKRWCQQGTLAVCEPHGPFGETVVTDCSALGLACDDRADSAACVVPGTSACDHAVPRCEGDALTFCAAGRRVHLVCRELGFSTCDPDAHGVEAACSVSPIRR